jgi:hypothetical protein
MNALAHDSWFDLSPDESKEDVPDLSVREEAALVAVIAMAIPVLFAASVLQVVYDALILVWALFALPLIRLTKATASVAAAGVERWTRG